MIKKLILNVAFFCSCTLLLLGIFWLARNISKRRLEPLTRQVVDSRQFDMRKHGRYLAVELSDERQIRCLNGATKNLRILIKNHSPFFVSSSLTPRLSHRPVNLGYYLKPKDSTDSEYVEQTEPHFTYAPAILPRLTMTSPTEKSVMVMIQCPDRPGEYDLRIEPVQESVGWLHEYGKKEQWIETSLNVVSEKHLIASRRAAQNPIQIALMRKGFSSKSASLIETTYWLAQQLLTLSINKISTSGGTYISLNAGTRYPMMWVRDMASIQRALAYFSVYDRRSDHFWADLFLIHQREDGSIPDWIALKGTKQGRQFGKNTIQSDQELWLLISVFEALKLDIIDQSWLQTPIDSQHVRQSTRLSSLTAAFGWLLKNRWNQKLGCLFSGHVADWGDVGLEGIDSDSSTKMDAGRPYVCGIFHQSLLYHVLEYIEELELLSFENLEIVQALGGLAHLKESAAKFSESLWHKQGYYKIHRHLEDFNHRFSEDEMFALGGNIVAIESGLASTAKAKQILETAVLRQNEFQMPTIGSTLLPPYPAGTFANPIMNETFEYQNGGQWDWFGARAAGLVCEFNFTTCKEKFIEIARQVRDNNGFYEWYDPKGDGHGSTRFLAGAAAFIYGVQTGLLANSRQ